MALEAAHSDSSSLVGRPTFVTPDVIRALAGAILVVWIAVFIYIGKPNSGPAVYSNTVVLQAMFALPVLVYVGWRLQARRLPGRTPLDWCVLALIGAYGIAVLTSINPRVSLEASLLIATPIIVYYAVYDLRALTVEFWSRVFVALVALISLASLVSVFGQYATMLEGFSAVEGDASLNNVFTSDFVRIKGALDHPSVLAMFLNLTLPFVAARVLNSNGRERALCIAVLLLGAMALFLTLTRGAWLATAAWIPMFATLAFMRLDASIHIARKALVRHSRLLMAAVVLALVVGITTLVVAYELQPGWLVRPTLDDRFEAVKIGLSIFSDHPLTGAGPQTFLLQNDLYGDGTSGDASLVHSHNIYIQILAETGGLGALAVFTGVLLFSRALWRSWAASSASEQLYIAAGISAVFGLMVHGLSDAPPSWNSILIPLAIVVAISIRFAPLDSSDRRVLAIIPRFAILALVPIVFAAWLLLDQAHAHYDASLRAIELERPLDAAREAAHAADLDPGLFAYQLNAGVAHARLYQSQLGSGSADPHRLDEAIAYLRRGIALDPNSALGYANLAIAFRLAGDMDQATESARRAIEHGPRDTNIYAIAGTVFEWAGETNEAVEAYAAAIEMDPLLTQAPFWSESSERLELRATVIEASDLDPCLVGRNAALYGLYTNDLPVLLEECQGEVTEGTGSRDSLALMLQAMGRYEAASLEASASARGHKGSSLATALIRAEDIREQRAQLLRLARSDKDAPILLAATYMPSIDDGYRLPVFHEAAVLPPVLREHLPRSGAITDLDRAVQPSQWEIRYFTWGALRETPPYVLIPGDWVLLTSPRVVLTNQIVEYFKDSGSPAP